VAKHLQNAHHIDVFRRLVTSDGIKPYLPVKNQSGLAKQLVALAKSQSTTDHKVELTGTFIRDNIMSLVLGAKTAERRWSRQELEGARRQNLIVRARNYQQDFARGCSLMIASGLKLQTLVREWPKGEPFPITQEFRSAVKDAKRTLDALERRI
jgi:hypothetical protein